MNGTQLYDADRQELFPITDANVVKSKADGSETSVEKCLLSIFGKLSELDGAESATSNIIVKVEYCKTNTKKREEISDQGWSENFVLPDLKNPYVWKRTTFTYKGDTTGTINQVLEISVTDISEKTQTIYTTKGTDEQPIIPYTKKLQDGLGNYIKPDGRPLDPEEEPYPDLTQYDDKLPDDWSETPISIGPGNPYVFMAVRHMNTPKQIKEDQEGKWDMFSTPALFGRWAYDSKLETRYATTAIEEPAPKFDNKNQVPGEAWSSKPVTDFTGKLWMITATSVNGNIQDDTAGIKWSGPYLMAIIK